MDRRNGGFSAEEQNEVSTSVNDALIFTTVSIVGFPVDVHVKDGSIYSGTFHTASVDDGYAVVLKKARMIKKGNRQTNVADGRLIDTLIVLSEDLVQVVAKELLLPAECISGKVSAADVRATAGDVPQNVREEKGANGMNPKEHNLEQKHINHTRLLDPVKNSIPNGSPHDNSVEVASGNSDHPNLVKRGVASTVSSNGRQVEDNSEENQAGFREEPVLQGRRITNGEVEGSRASLDSCGNQSSPAENVNATTNEEEPPNFVSFERYTVAELDNQSHEGNTLEEAQPLVALSSSVSADATSVVRVASDFGLNSSSTSTVVVFPKTENHGRTAKESKLNPRAKLFSPSPVQHRSATPPAVLSPRSLTHSPDPSTVVPIAAAESEVDMSSFAYRSSVPAKFLPQNNVFIGNGRGDPHFIQPIVGHVASRTQPVRYVGHYNHIQAGPAFVHPNSQNVMAGHMGPLVYVQPVSNDASQGTARFSQLSSRPLLTPYQVNLPKHQGTAAMQAMQLCVTPPLLANGQQPFAMPSYIPISPPLFPVVGSIPVSRSDVSLSTKFA